MEEIGKEGVGKRKRNEALERKPRRVSGGEEDTDIYPPSERSIKIKRLVAGLKSGIQWRS